MSKGEKMNLIDKEKLLEALNKERIYARFGCEEQIAGLIQAIEITKEQAIIEERKHGHYIHKGAWHLECSECSNILAHICEEKNFCPNCGAIMDEDEVITC